MNDFLKERLLRQLSTLSDDKVYQVLDYAEFLGSKYAEQKPAPPNVFQRFAEGVEDTMRAVFIRAPWVESVGPSVEVLARVEAGPQAGTIVAVQQGAVMATSFHPEITADHRVHEYFVNLVRAS